MALKTKSVGGPLRLSAGGKLSCLCCCPTVLPTVQYDARSASKTKCGYSEFSGFVSSPPKKYRTRTWSGARVETSYLLPGCTGSSSTDTLAISGSANYDSACSCTAAFVSTFNGTPTNITDCNATTTWATDITSATTKEDFDRANTGTCQPGNFIIDQADSLDELSDEYTTAQLLTNTTAALGAFPDTWVGTAGSYYNLTTDELTNSIREDKARIPLASVGLVSGTDYVLHYLRRFTPDVGSVVDTPATVSFTYNGTDTHLAIETITIPTTNGTTTIVLDYWECP